MSASQQSLSFMAVTFRCPVCLYESCCVCEPCIFDGGQFKPKLIIRLMRGWNLLVFPVNHRLAFARIDGRKNFLTNHKHIPRWLRIPTFSMDWQKMEKLDWTYTVSVAVCRICGSHFYEEDPRDHTASITEDDIGEDNSDNNNRFPPEVWKHDLFDHQKDAKPFLPFRPVAKPTASGSEAEG